MGKRKVSKVDRQLSSRRTEGSITARPDASKHDVEETFADSEDDFFAGHDKVLLEEGPSQKKRRKLDEEGSDILRC
jgi:U3 small nucleolar RNA-associated protein 3